MHFCQNYVHFNIILFIFQLWSWKQLLINHLSRSFTHVPVHIDEELLTNALGCKWRVPLSHTDSPHHVLVTYKDEFDK